MALVRPPQLFPVSLDLPSWNLRDSFMWPSDNGMQPQEYAAVLVKDYGLPEEAVRVVAKKLAAQIARFGDVWEAKWQQLSSGGARRAEVRQLVLEVDLGECVLRDRFEWDINNLANSPELFAEELVCDLALKREHEVLIVHAIRTALFQAWEASLQTGGAQTVKREAEAAVRFDPDGQWGPRLTPPAKAEAATAAAGDVGLGGERAVRRRRTSHVDLSGMQEDEDEGGGGEEEEEEDEDEEGKEGDNDNSEDSYKEDEDE